MINEIEIKAGIGFIDGNLYQVIDEKSYFFSHIPEEELEAIPNRYYLTHLPTMDFLNERYFLFKGKLVNYSYDKNDRLNQNNDNYTFSIEYFLYMSEYEPDVYNDNKNRISYIRNDSPIKDLRKASNIGYFSKDSVLEEFDELNLDIIVYLDLKYELDIHKEILDLV